MRDVRCPGPSSPLGRERGLTLIELMITLSILAIIVALAGPPYRQFIQSNRMSAAASELQRALTLARTESMARVRSVTVCPSSNGTACAAGGDWRQGWLVYVDLDGSGALTANDPILLVQQAISGLASIKPLSDGTAGAFNNGVTYVGSGQTSGLQGGRLLFCDDRGIARARAVYVMPLAIPRVDGALTTDSCP